MTLADFRAQFPHAERMVYLDHASTGPLSRAAVEAVGAYLHERSVTNPNNFPMALPRVEAVRGALARLLGTDAARVEFAPNTSHAINVLAQGYPWQPGDRVAVPACEFPANLLPWRALAARGVEVDLIPAPGGTFALDDVAAALRPTTRVVAVSFVQFLSGFRADVRTLADLAHAHGALLAVDAIQGLGALRLDVEAAGVDFLAGGGQKWLLAMQGSAFLYVTEALQDRLTPLRGWLNGPVDWDDFGATGLDWHPDASRFRVGTLATAPLLALGAALGLFEAVGPDAVERRVLEAAGHLADGLDRLGLRRFGTADPAHASGIVTVEHAAPEALHAHLAARGVVASVRDRKLRLAPHAYATDADLAAALDAVASFGRTAHAVPASPSRA